MQKPSGLLRPRLGGRANSAVYGGRAVPCPERKLKSATTCFRAGFYLPAAGPLPVTAVESQISKAHHHDTEPLSRTVAHIGRRRRPSGQIAGFYPAVRSPRPETPRKSDQGHPGKVPRFLRRQ